MPTPIPKSTSTLNTGYTTTDTTSVGSAPAATKSAPPPEPKKAEQEDPKAAAKSAKGSKDHATERKSQQNVSGQVTQKMLNEQIHASDKKGEAAPPKDTSGLKPGEAISANVKEKKDGFHFEFERPVNKEQAGGIIFRDGKVPDDAKLVQGTGNNWVVQVPNDIEARNNTTKHFNAHTETVTTPSRKPTDVYPPDSQNKHTWTGGALKTTDRNQRHDLKNDLGFTISNSYQLDQGQRPKDTLGLPGMGYEVGFEKPMTKDQVMKKFFDKEKIDHGGKVQLIPMSREPATQWKVEVIGVDAASSFKRGVGRAVADANIYGKESLQSDTPPGIRIYVNSQSIPAHAANPKPNVYVWEQEGHMVHVKSNNKGKDGYYEAQVTKMPTEKQGRKWMQENMLQKGMEPREAWRTFWNDTVDITKLQVGMIGGAARAPQMMRDAKVSKSAFGGEEPVQSPGLPKPKPTAKGPTGTLVGHPPPPPKNIDVSANTKPSAPPGKAGGRANGNTLPGALYDKIGRPEYDPPPLPSWFPKKSGTPLTPSQVLHIHRTDPNRIQHSLRPDQHELQWRSANPQSNEPPPPAFTTKDGMVHVNEPAWVASGQPSIWMMEPRITRPMGSQGARGND